MDRLESQRHHTMQEYYRRCREAEEYHAEEQHAAVVLQAAWRGCLQREELEKLRRIATTIQKCWRGYLGRRRFSAALAAHNTQLRQAYFDHHATIIQKHWRGHFSRSRIHDYYTRQAFLRAVAAANAAVKAEMQAELQAALQHQQREAQAAAKQHFNTQVSKLHCLSSTASIPGIFSPPAAAAAAAPYTVAGQPLEQHLRAAVKHKAAVAVRQQQTVIRKALGNTQGGVGIFPAGVPAHTGGPAACDCGPATTAAAGAPAQRLPPAQAVRGTQHLGGSSSGRKLACSQQPSAGCVNTTRAAAAIITAAATAGNGDGITTSTTNSSRGSSRGSSSQKLQQLVEQKLAARIVEACVDQKFAARATPNMPDGRSFNPGLSLQQSTDYEAVVEAADLERRLERGLMLVLHNGQPFIPIVGKLEPPAAAAAASEQEAANDQHTRCQQVGDGVTAEVVQTGHTAAGAAAQRLWKNTCGGGMFDRNLKQVY